MRAEIFDRFRNVHQPSLRRGFCRDCSGACASCSLSARRFGYYPEESRCQEASWAENSVERTSSFAARRRADGVCRSFGRDTCAAPGTPKSQYDYALSLMLGQQDFAAAERALKAFVEQHPQDDLTGNAQYWLGETYYVRRSYQNAAFAFAEGYQRYPKNRKAPDSLLKLGMSLSRMGKRKEACTAFSRFLSKYTRANDRLKARIDRERRQAKCR